MEIIILTLLTLFAVNSKAQVRAELELSVIPTVNIERLYTESVRVREGSEWKDVLQPRVQNTIETFQEQIFLIRSYGQELQNKMYFNLKRGVFPVGNGVGISLETVARLSTKEAGSDSLVKLEINSTENVQTAAHDYNIKNKLKPEENFKLTLQSYKIKGILKIQYFVPQGTHLLEATSSVMENLFSKAQTYGFSNTLSEEVEQRIDPNRYVYVQPGSAIEEVIEIPEQTILQTKNLKGLFEMTLKRNLYEGGKK